MTGHCIGSVRVALVHGENSVRVPQDCQILEVTHDVRVGAMHIRFVGPQVDDMTMWESRSVFLMEEGGPPIDAKRIGQRIGSWVLPNGLAASAFAPRLASKADAK